MWIFAKKCNKEKTLAQKFFITYDFFCVKAQQAISAQVFITADNINNR